MKKINDRLKEERLRLGFNKGKMAASGHIANSTYTNYEDGKRSPDGDFLSAIAAVGADVQYILTGLRGKQYRDMGGVDAVPDMVANNRSEYLTPRQKALLDNVEHCSEEDQRAIERMALLAAKADTDAMNETTNGQEEAINPMKKSA
jgi:transcriptional regulator with XRE-family HTH domain